MKNIEKVVKERHSVRSYLDKPIENNKEDFLNELITKINHEEDLHIQLILDNKDVFDKFILHYGRLKNAKNYLAMIGKKSDVKLEEKIGYFGEKIVLTAQELGLNTCWVAGTYSKGAVKANIAKDEKLVCIIAIGYGMSAGVAHNGKTFDEVSITKDVPAWYKKGIEYALLAPTALNQQKFKFILLDNNIVLVKTKKGPLTKIDLGIIKYHFELGADINNFHWQEET